MKREKWNGAWMGWYPNGKQSYSGSYLDNGKENIAPQNWSEYERLREVYKYYLSVPVSERDDLPKKIQREYREYKNVILGSFRDNNNTQSN